MTRSIHVTGAKCVESVIVALGTCLAVLPTLLMRLLPMRCLRCALLVALPAACGSAAVEQPGPAPVDPRLYQAVVPRVAASKPTAGTERATAEAWARGLAQPNLEAIAPLLDPEGDFSFPGMSDATDRTGTLKALGDLFGAFSDRKVTQGRIWQIDPVSPAQEGLPHVSVLPPVVILEWGMTGVQSSLWMDVAPTQKPVTIHGIGVLWFDQNGLVNDTHCYFDVGAVLAQLGAAPKSIEPPAPLTLADGAPVLATGSADENKNVSIVNTSWDALEAKNEAGYLAPIADNIEVFRLDRALPERGKAARKSYFKWVTGGFSGLSQTPSNSWGIGSFVVEEYTLAGGHSGRLTDAPPSGHALRLHYLDVDEMKDGKIVRTWTFGNSLELLAQTGQIERATPGNSASVVR